MIQWVVCLALQVLLILLIVYVVFSWIPRPPDPVVPFARWVTRIVSPVLEPIRRISPKVQLGGVGLDLSVIILFFGIAIVQQLIGCS